MLQYLDTSSGPLLDSLQPTNLLEISLHRLEEFNNPTKASRGPPELSWHCSAPFRWFNDNSRGLWLSPDTFACSSSDDSILATEVLQCLVASYSERSAKVPFASCELPLTIHLP
jgi:hypothetical protein